MKIALIAAGAIALTATTSTAQDYSAPYSSYFAFGDSLTDDGKFGPGSLAPPSLDGRFSNGITYAEHIEMDFEATGRFTFNFALGGATAEADNENAPFYPPEALPFATFGAQVSTFAGLNASPAGAEVGDRPLISVLFGGNDLLQDLGESPTVGSDAADAVKAGIESIAAIDDKFNTFVVGNLGDLGATPLFADSPFQALATATSAQFDNQLAANIDMLRDGGLTIIEFDLAALNQRIFDDPGAFGLATVTEPCTPSFNAFTPNDNCAFDPNTGEIDITAADPFFFADEVHPNRIVQAAAADEFRAAVAAVPLPAGLPLLLAGIGVFGFFRFRRAA